MWRLVAWVLAGALLAELVSQFVIRLLGKRLAYETEKALEYDAF